MEPLAILIARTFGLSITDAFFLLFAVVVPLTSFAIARFVFFLRLRRVPVRSREFSPTLVSVMIAVLSHVVTMATWRLPEELAFSLHDASVGLVIGGFLTWPISAIQLPIFLSYVRRRTRNFLPVPVVWAMTVLSWCAFWGWLVLLGPFN